MIKGKARLLTAYVWDCEECGSENFERAITAEIVDEDREAIFRQFHQMDPWEPLPEGWRDFQLVTRPDSVTCCKCGTEFDAEDDRDE